MRPKRFAIPVLLGPMLATALAAALAAQHSPYAGLEEREIKALAEERVAGYLEGHGMSYALAAELNGYPGPKHVLELAAELELSDDQKTAVEAIRAAMLERARALGKEIVDRERHLDRRFAHRHIDEAALRDATAEIARLYGELRFAHLRAHLETRAALTEAQIELYDRLRGYRKD